MSNTSDQYVKERPAWLIPAAVILGVVIFSAVFVYYYFGPTPSEILGLDPRASESTHRVDVEIGELHFLIPANFTRYPLQRAGGRQSQIDLHALLPELSPYALGRQAAFESNAADADVVHIKLHLETDMLPAVRRLDEIYRRHFEYESAQEGPYDLLQYSFAVTSGYRNQDLYVADQDSDPLLLLCFQASEIVFSPNCTRTFHISENVALTYRYKRAHLEDWQRIDGAVTALIRSFTVTDEPVSDLEP